MQVTTSEGTDRFRPRRLAWKEATRFRVAGLTERREIHRITLRFETPELAVKAASILKETAEMVEEPLVSFEEIDVQARFLLKRMQTRLVAVVLALTIPTIPIAVSILFSTDASRTILLKVTLPLYAIVILEFLVLLRYARRRVSASLRLEGDSLYLRTKHSSSQLGTELVDWKNPTTFVLDNELSRIEVSFPTSNDATQAVQKLKSKFPEIRETFSLQNPEAV